MSLFTETVEQSLSPSTLNFSTVHFNIKWSSLDFIPRCESFLLNNQIIFFISRQSPYIPPVSFTLGLIIIFKEILYVQNGLAKLVM
jgi:hypothetical protein